MKVELKPHVSKSYSGAVVEFDERLIYADQTLVGKLGNDIRCRICWLKRLPDEQRLEIENDVRLLTGRAVSNRHMPPDLVAIDNEGDDIGNIDD